VLLTAAGAIEWLMSPVECVVQHALGLLDVAVTVRRVALVLTP
jgi:hypothetical protein